LGQGQGHETKKNVEEILLLQYKTPISSNSASVTQRDVKFASGVRYSAVVYRTV